MHDGRCRRYLHTRWNPHTYAQPICGTLQILTQTHIHRPPFMPTPTHSISLASNLASNRNPTDADELQPSLLGDDHSLSWSSSTPLVFDTQTWLTHHFLRLPFHQSPLLCRHRCPRSYTLWVGADGSYSSPSIRALWGEQGDHNPPDCMCVYIYIYIIYVCIHTHTHNIYVFVCKCVLVLVSILCACVCPCYLVTLMMMDDVVWQWGWCFWGLYLCCN